MSRLIDAEDFSRALRQYMKDCINQKKYNMDVVDMNVDIQNLLYNQPTAFDVDKALEEVNKLEQEIELLTKVINKLECEVKEGESYGNTY